MPTYSIDSQPLYNTMKICIIPALLILAISFELPWIKPDQLNRGLPPSIQIYTLNTSSSPFNSKLTGGYARFNMNDTNL